MVYIMLSENLHRTFTADDIDQSTGGIIKNVVSVTERGQTGDDSPLKWRCRQIPVGMGRLNVPHVD
jgi:hypothetical protein